LIDKQQAQMFYGVQRMQWAKDITHARRASIFTWKTILPSFTTIRFEMIEPWTVLRESTQHQKE